MPTRGRRADRLREWSAANKLATAQDDLVDAYFADLEGTPVLPAAESARLCQLAQSGDLAARNACVEGNLRLVVFVARRFRPTVRGVAGVEMADLIQEGNVGLLRAVMGFQATYGAFGTYAHRCILSHMLRYAGEASSPIHVPEYVRVHLRAEHRGTPITSPHVARLHPESRKAALRAARVRSLDAEFEPLGQSNRVEPDAMTLGETLADPAADTEGDALEAAERAEIQRTLALVFKGLTPRERMVLRLRFGLEGIDEHTLESAGAVLGITRERVRQIEETAIRKLRERLELLPDGSLILGRLLAKWRAA